MQKATYMSQRPFSILGIDHVGFVVKDRQAISKIFGDFLGLNFMCSEEVSDQRVITDIYSTGICKLEFLQSTSDDSPITSFIEKKGAGMHHIALIVDKLQSALDYLKDNGFQLIDKTPRIGAEGYKIAFIHPKSTNGILVELCEKK